MFEKEAELRSTKWFRENVDGSTYTTPFTERFCYELGFRSGAEFGYNKANEWHCTKDGEYPEEHQLVLLYRENPNGANVALSYWYKSYVNDKVIAWKEVTPPKE